MRLFFLTSSRIGDAVLSTGLLGHLLEQNPGAEVTVAAGSLAAPLFQHVPGLTRLIAVEKRPYKGHWLSLWRQVGLQRWDLVVDLRASFITRFLFTRAAITVGRADQSVPRVVELARAAGLVEPPAPRLWLGAEDEAAADRLLASARGFLALAPTANWPAKQWPAERFVALAKALTDPGGLLAGMPVVVFGAAKERDMAAPLLAANFSGGLIDLVGQTPLLPAAAALKRARLFVGNDSGLMHMAAAVGTPTLGLFGPSSRARYAPWGPHVLAVEAENTHPDATGNRMGALALEKVMSAVETLIAQKRI